MSKEPKEIKTNSVDLESVTQCIVEIEKESREFTGSYIGANQDLVYVILLDPDATTEFGDEDQATLAIQVGWAVFPVFRVLPSSLNTPVIVFFEELNVKQVGKNLYKYTAKYSFNRNEGQSGSATAEEDAEILPEIRINFATGGSTRHITKSLNTTAEARSVPAAGFGVPRDLKGAIGASRDTIAGADVLDDSLTIQITVYYLPQYYNFELISKLRDATACVNSQKFMDQDAGTVLYTGSSGGGAIFDVIPVTHEFLIKRDPPVFDEGFPNLVAGAHDIIDYVFKHTFDPAAGDFVLAEPVYRYVHLVYPWENLSAVFGFGGE